MTRYRKRRCRICNTPVNQANDDLREPLCSEHRLEQLGRDLATIRAQVCAL